MTDGSAFKEIADGDVEEGLQGFDCVGERDGDVRIAHIGEQFGEKHG